MSADPPRTPAAERQARARERAAAARQLTGELLELGRLEARQAGLPLMPAVEPEQLAPEPAKGGRPAGSIARKTAEWAAFMLQRYRSPLVVMAETYSRPLKDLAQELGCSPLEAFELQMKAAAELAPYVHSKMPTGLQLEAPEAPVVLAVSPEFAARMGLPAPAPQLEGEAVEEQGLSEGEPA